MVSVQLCYRGKCALRKIDLPSTTIESTTSKITSTEMFTPESTTTPKTTTEIFIPKSTTMKITTIQSTTTEITTTEINTTERTTTARPITFESSVRSATIYIHDGYIPIEDFWDAGDPYVEVSIDGRHLGRTGHATDTHHPVFNDAFSTGPLQTSDSNTIILEVYDKDIVTNHDFHCEIRIMLKDVWRNEQSSIKRRLNCHKSSWLFVTVTLLNA